MERALRALLLSGLLSCICAEPVGVVINGATGKPSAANGVYFQTDIRYNGHNCYKKEHVKLWLCMDSNSLWNVQVESMRGGNMGILVSTDRKAPSPLEAGPWKVYDNGAEAWVADPGVVVTPAQEGATPPDPNSEDVTVTTAGSRLRKTVATMLFGAFAVAMVSLALSGSTDAHVRSYFHKLLSSTMTFLISLLITEAIWDLLFEQLLPAEAPKGLGLGYPVKPGVKIVTSFVVFTLSYMSLNFLGWKFQFSRARLYVVRTLGSHLCACFAIGTFTAIQHEAVFTVSVQFEGPSMTPEAARNFTAFLVVVLAWCTFALYRAAATGVREDVFKQPPLKPWPAPSNPPSKLTGETRAASCTDIWATQPVPAVMKKAPGPNWGAFVNAAEDEAAVIVLGYLLNQSITFVVSGELPGLKVVYTYHSETMIRFWCILIACFLVLLLLILAIRSKFGDGGRVGSIINRTTAMALAWSVYRAAKWATTDFLADNHPLLAVQGAFVISAIAVTSMLLLDKLLDWALGRNGHPGLRRMMGNFQDADGMPLSERGMRIVMNCMGLLVALAWETAISFSVETVVLQTKYLSDHVVISKAVIFIVIGAVMIYPWRRIVLPTSEMSERHIEESIKHELLQMDRAEGFMPVSTA